jgi:glutaredoxin 3
MLTCLIRREFSTLRRLIKVETGHFTRFTPDLNDYGASLIKNRINFSTSLANTIFPSRNFPNITQRSKSTPIQFVSLLAEHQQTRRNISIMEVKDRDLNIKSRDVATRVQELIQTNAVMVFSKSYCPFSRRVKELFGEGLRIPYGVIELDQDSQGSAIMDYLNSLTGQKTVPNVFINGQHIGGCDSTYEAHRQGKIQSLLASVVAGTTTTPAITSVATTTGALVNIIFLSCVQNAYH